MADETKPIELLETEPLEKSGVLTCAGTVARFGSKLVGAKDAVQAYWTDVVDVAIKAATDDDGDAPGHIVVPLPLNEALNPHLGALICSLGFQGDIGKDEQGGRYLKVWGWVGKV